MNNITHQSYLTKLSALTKVADANSLASSQTQTYKHTNQLADSYCTPCRSLTFKNVPKFPEGNWVILSCAPICLPSCLNIGNALLNRSKSGSNCLPIASSKSILITVLIKSP